MLKFAMLSLGLAVLAAPSFAQVIQTTPVPAGPPPVVAPTDKIELTPGATPGLTRQADPDELAAKPGAYLIAGFDTDRDGDINQRELMAGAEASFRAADVNASGSIDGFEQTAWAKTEGGGDEVLGNVMLFDTNLDQQVTHAEFIAGVLRLAEPLKTADSGTISLSSLKIVRSEDAQRPRPMIPVAGR